LRPFPRSSASAQTIPLRHTQIHIFHPVSLRSSFLTIRRLEWKQWISRDYFVHSNQCWYSLQYGIGADNSFNSYNTFRALANIDVRPWLSLSADAQVILSPAYNAS
jgi:hypothetical protein